MSDGRTRERADAARNRRAILDATRALLAEHGAEGVTMERVAAAAGVGKGTIFHRFGSRAGLLHELVAEPAVALMEAVSSGPPPLGPGAPAAERLLAYFAAMTDLVIDNIELVVAYNAVPPHPRREEFHAFWAAHITAMLRGARPDLDAEVVGALLLAPLGGELASRMVRAGEADRLRAAVHDLVASVLRAPASET
ncbi:TetR/AcrR family transcriptional regulator [Nocardia bhagyanarayanae]|uniref:TetR family transcriptional regulator n=1 Tax=Nocardia bhagyanarayanae TaxID=1215925 RepID=A0A543FDG6_9NOCA|nr:TetR/AcrR family transcriptional regulator [Nocardia bhagyanarayanae]TQM31877.1 TetR family transcriptional regulator [Nocardia bhagyanarayanae]